MRITIFVLVLLLASRSGFSAEPGTRRYYLNLCAASAAAVATVGVFGVGLRSWQVFGPHQRILIEGRSMAPTLEHLDEINIRLGSSNIVRGDIVVLGRPDGLIESLTRGVAIKNALVKRVVGLPGDEINLQGYQILVDGTILKEPYIRTRPASQEELRIYTGEFREKNNEIAKSADNWGRSIKKYPIVLGVDEYFVVGDNRPLSKDSRHIGPVSVDYILGVVTQQNE